MSIGIVNLCPAAYFYLVISIIAIVVMRLNIFGTNQVFCLGTYNCDASISETSTVIWIKIVYVLFWTWVLNIVCRKITPEIAWLFALAPFLLFFFLLFAVLFLGMKSGFTTMEPLTNKKPLTEVITYTGTNASNIDSSTSDLNSYMDTTGSYSSYDSPINTTSTSKPLRRKGIFSGISMPTSARLEIPSEAPTLSPEEEAMAGLSPSQKLMLETQLETQKQNLELLKSCNNDTSIQMMEEIQKQNLELLKSCKESSDLNSTNIVQSTSAVIS